MKVSIATLKKMIREAVEECYDSNMDESMNEDDPVDIDAGRAADTSRAEPVSSGRAMIAGATQRGAASAPGSTSMGSMGGAPRMVTPSARRSTTNEAVIRRIVYQEIANLNRDFVSEAAIRKLVRKNVYEALRGGKR